MDYIPRGTRTVDHFILGSAAMLRDRGWEVRYAFGAPPPPAFTELLAKTGAGWVVVPFPFTRASTNELFRALGPYRPDVTVTSFLSAFTPAVRWLRTSGFTRRLVIIDHSSGEVPRREGLLRLAARLRGWWVGRVVDAVLPVSHAIAKRDIEQVFLPARKVRVVHNGIQPNSFSNPPRLSRDVVRVVYAGQLIPEKGVLTLLKAHARLRQAGVTKYELLIAGTGPQEGELKSFCQSAGHADVRFLGHIDSVSELFSSADVVVVPSEWFEAFGLVAAEAMASGAACLVSDAGGLPEVVGEVGRVFKAGSDSDLAQQLRDLIDSPELRRQLGQAGHERFVQLFTMDRAIRERIAVYEQVHAGSALAAPVVR